MKGISLVEVLVSLSIFSVTILCAMNAVLNGLKLSQQSIYEVTVMSNLLSTFEKQQHRLIEGSSDS